MSRRRAGTVGGGGGGTGEQDRREQRAPHGIIQLHSPVERLADSIVLLALHLTLDKLDVVSIM